MRTGDLQGQPGEHAAVHAAHHLILEQHRELRRLLALGLVQTWMQPRRQQSDHADLKALVDRIRALFVQHIADEEPLFDHGLLGPRRMQILREEHARQRRELDELHVLSEAGSGAALTNRFDSLARSLLIDIADEERELARAVAALDEGAARRLGVIDDLTGSGRPVRPWLAPC